MRGVVLQECSPRLRRRPPRPDHVLRHCRLRDSQAELQQFAVDSRCTPQRIRAAHLPYQIPQVPPNRGPTPSASTLPCPVEPEAPAVPPHHGLEPHHLQGTPPILPEPRHHDPEDPVHLRQPRPWLTRFPHGSRRVRTAERNVRRRIPSHLTMTGQIADYFAQRKIVATDEFLEGTTVRGLAKTLVLRGCGRRHDSSDCHGRDPQRWLV